VDNSAKSFVPHAFYNSFITSVMFFSQQATNTEFLANAMKD